LFFFFSFIFLFFSAADAGSRVGRATCRCGLAASAPGAVVELDRLEGADARRIGEWGRMRAAKGSWVNEKVGIGHRFGERDGKDGARQMPRWAICSPLSVGRLTQLTLSMNPHVELIIAASDEVIEADSN